MRTTPSLRTASSCRGFNPKRKAQALSREERGPGHHRGLSPCRFSLVFSSPYAPKCLEKLSEKVSEGLQRSLTGRRNGTFRPIFAISCRPDTGSERYSDPFSDS